MNEANMKTGVRVRVARDIVYAAGQSAPDRVLPAGRTGTVEALRYGLEIEDAIALVRMDDPTEEFGPKNPAYIVWNWRVPECTAEDFEAIDPVLTTHTIAVHRVGGDIPIFFVCEAEDEDHAFEQAVNAYPDYSMVTVACPDDYLVA